MWVNLINFQFFLQLFDPKSRLFGISEILFAIIMILYIIKINKLEKISKSSLVFYILYFFIPIIYGLLISCFTDKMLASYYIEQNIIRGIFGLIIFPISRISKIDLEHIVMRNLYNYSKVLIVFWFFSFILMNLNFFYIVDKIYWFGREKEIFLLHQLKIKNLILPNIFTGNIVLLTFSYAYFLFKKRKKNWIIALFLLLQSGTAANFLSGILISIYYIYSKLVKKLTLKVKFILFCFMGIIGLFIFKELIFFSGDSGNSTKWLHLISYINLWRTRPNAFIFGEGIGTGLYTLAYNREVFLTEIFYFEIIRIYGIIIFTLIIYCLIKILNNIVVLRNEWLMISYLAYLCISGTNPYLFGVTGSFMISIIFVLTKKE